MAITTSWEGRLPQDLGELMRTVVRDLSGVELTDGDLDAPLDSLDVDSLVLVDVICEIESILGLELEDELLQRMIQSDSLRGIVRTYEAAVR